MRVTSHYLVHEHANKRTNYGNNNKYANLRTSYELLIIARVTSNFYVRVMSYYLLQVIQVNFDMRTTTYCLLLELPL